MQRGEVYFTKTGAVNNAGYTVYTPRPAIVVSTDDINTSEHAVEVVFLTSSPKRDNDFHVQFMCRDRLATALCEQITTVEATALTDYIMTVPDDIMYDIENAICRSLGLEFSEDVPTKNSKPVYGWKDTKDWEAEAKHWKELYLQQLKITAEVMK